MTAVDRVGESLGLLFTTSSDDDAAQCRKLRAGIAEAQALAARWYRQDAAAGGQASAQKPGAPGGKPRGKTTEAQADREAACSRAALLLSYALTVVECAERARAGGGQTSSTAASGGLSDPALRGLNALQSFCEETNGGGRRGGCEVTPVFLSLAADLCGRAPGDALGHLQRAWSGCAGGRVAAQHRLLTARALIRCAGDPLSVDSAAGHLEACLRLDPTAAEAAQLLRDIQRLSACRDSVSAAVAQRKPKAAAGLIDDGVRLAAAMGSAKLEAGFRLHKAELLASSLRDAPGAARQCTLAIALDRENPAAFRKRASAYLKLHRFEDAVRDLETAVRVGGAPHRPALLAARKAWKASLASQQQQQTRDKRHPACGRCGAYKALGVAPGAAPGTVAKAYRSLALQCHPDRHPAASRLAAEQRFKEVSNAYSVLSNPAQPQSPSDPCPACCSVDRKE
ncbi:DnaJ-like protein subfamily C member 7-like protein [Diplonema papillatum]|nr:DnaJ-like protein subfamily C member 7-like protein [Diplonema papillatum]